VKEDYCMVFELTAPPDTELSHRTGSAEVILAATAHEMRLPLSHIKGFVTSLLRTDVTWDSATRDDFLHEIEVETERLGDMIESMLGEDSAAQHIPGAHGFQSIRPSDLVRSALHRVGAALGDHPIHVNVPERLPAVSLDRDGMERVLANLVENAAKYSPDGTRIEISGRMATDSLELVVQDRGTGVRAEDRERIFWPFYRSPSTVKGYGLGLAIALSIVRAHGGQILLDDRPGGGARFTVRLPRIQRSSCTS
jgi:two-component system, OmpR family, sensor histidine kinase KdpD